MLHLTSRDPKIRSSTSKGVRHRMTEEQKKALFKLLEKGCTDSDLEDFAYEYGISFKCLFTQVAAWNAPDECKTCKYVQMRNTHPCINCRRGKQDLYEAAEQA